jgi:hypothetical protein
LTHLTKEASEQNEIEPYYGHYARRQVDTRLNYNWDSSRRFGFYLSIDLAHGTTKTSYEFEHIELYYHEYVNSFLKWFTYSSENLKAIRYQLQVFINEDASRCMVFLLGDLSDFELNVIKEIETPKYGLSNANSEGL